ncbi:CelD/BcsL family acetyltransferase involved in cellulose biosynthesis [Sphingomonas insulae]|uniref:BioF2-like acetyltransferase domain-containing protein n=1 Tax=Sphingomonas insulae TaxID=424800 RepID=A0ABN1HWC2_9SPHN|nr:GNAT family N-acetyltransferase [Sphingomonas insulae]NIJ28699.1 CelD/BcsL family acetyltransferase involved in cellulose biosynthesis [Sphingomonas insulae]
MTAVALKFQVGARTLVSVDRHLARVALSLDDVLAGQAPALPAAGRDGYLVTSLPSGLAGAVRGAGLMAIVRQRYTRFYTDLTIGHDAWLASLSGSARSTLKRKTRKAATAGVEVRTYRTSDELAAFYPLARAVSAKTYQERLLDAGLPEDAASVAHLHDLASMDGLRAWLLLLDGQPAAYLCCTAQGSALRYDHVGHDPAWNDWSPGTVLQAAAMKTLFGDRFARFDFTEGEGQHKRLFATGGVDCVDLLLLRRTFANRATMTALGAFDGAMAAAKRATRHPMLAGLAKRVRR